MEHILLNKNTYKYQPMKYLCIKFTNPWLQKSKKCIDIFLQNTKYVEDKTSEVA